MCPEATPRPAPVRHLRLAGAATCWEALRRVSEGHPKGIRRVSEGYAPPFGAKKGRGPVPLRTPSPTQLRYTIRSPSPFGYIVRGDLLPTRRARVRDRLGDICASEPGACRGVSGQYHQAPVPQIRKPKAEIRRKSEFRSPKHLSPWPGSSPLRQSWVRISSFGLPSDFGPLRPVVLTLLIRMLDKRGETQRRQQFSLWPCHPPPGEGTRPTSPAKPPACRPGALTRRPHLVHNENCCRGAEIRRDSQRVLLLRVSPRSSALLSVRICAARANSLGPM